MKEIWKDIKGYERLYQVSNLGRIKSLERKVISYNRGRTYERTYPEKILKQAKDKDGYVQVNLSKNGKGRTRKVHRLVAQAFISNFEEKPEVNHINGIRDDDRVDNLEWCTSSENNIHAYKVLKRGYKLPNKEQRKKYLDKVSKEIIQYEIKIVEKARYKSIREAERQTGILHTLISKCCNKKQETAGGYIWKFTNNEEK